MSDQKPDRALPEIEATSPPSRPQKFTTVSGYPIRQLYTADDLAGWDPSAISAQPGEPPYTRGIHPTMYRGRLWTMRQFAGFGAAEDTNERFRYLLAQGQTGLSVAFDLPTLMGYDSDHPLAHGEVGKCGVAISSLADMEVLFKNIPLAEVTTSMTINSPAAIIWAMYLAVAEKQGADWKMLSGTLQNDILKEYIAQKEYIYPPEPSLRLVIDTFEFGTRHTPRFNPISISGYHIREAGSTAIQELAFTLRDGIEYVERGIQRGLAVDEFAPQLSFFFNAHNDFFEEIAKYRAARRIWQRECASVSARRCALLGAAISRADGGLLAYRAAALQQRGAHGDSGAGRGDGRDAIAAHQLARRSLGAADGVCRDSGAAHAADPRYESGVTSTADPLGGSFFLESLTNEVERGANEYIEKIDAMGGMVAAIERGYPQREIAEAAYGYQLAVDRKEKIIVGVNDYVMEEKPHEILQIDEERGAAARRERLRQLREGAIGRGGTPEARRSQACGRGHGESDAAPLRSRRKPTPRWAKSAMRCARFSAHMRRSP